MARLSGNDDSHASWALLSGRHFTAGITVNPASSQSSVLSVISVVKLLSAPRVRAPLHSQRITVNPASSQSSVLSVISVVKLSSGPRVRAPLHSQRITANPASSQSSVLSVISVVKLSSGPRVRARLQSCRNDGYRPGRRVTEQTGDMGNTSRPEQGQVEVGDALENERSDGRTDPVRR